MYIKVKSFPGARKEQVIEKSSDHFDIYVKEKALQNMANKRICELVALRFHIPVDAVRIINGHHSTSKLLSLSIEE